MQPRTLILTDPAKADLDDIYDYIAVDDPLRAETYIAEIVTDLHRVAGLGYTGVARDWIRPGLRLHVYGSYNAYFTVDAGNFVVLRIVRGSRDINRIVFPGEIN